MRVELATVLGIAVLCVLGSCGDDEEPTSGGAGGRGGQPNLGGAPAQGSAGEAGASLPPGGPATCPEGSCNYQTQAGCEADRACRPSFAGDDSAVPSCEHPHGTGVPGAACESWNDCERGSVCANGVCRTMCCGGDWSACGVGHSCYGALMLRAPSSALVPSGVGLCLPTAACDLLDPNSCDDDALGCQLVDARGNVACLARGTGEFGAPCGDGDACAPLFTCVGEEERRMCRRLCNAEPFGEPSCPAAEGVCVQGPSHPPGVGVCTPSGP